MNDLSSGFRIFEIAEVTFDTGLGFYPHSVSIAYEVSHRDRYQCNSIFLEYGLLGYSDGETLSFAGISNISGAVLNFSFMELISTVFHMLSKMTDFKVNRA